MSATVHRASRLVMAVAACAAVGACGSLDNVSNRIVGSIAPYKVEVVQGNFVSREQVEAIKPGMGRQQVRDILGTPLVASIFHADRWDYVFTLKRQGVPPQERRLTVFFKGNALDHFEGDEMPTEADFVASLDNKRKNAKIPPLEASEERLKQFASTASAAASAPAAPAASASAPATTYPPLEAPGR